MAATAVLLRLGGVSSMSVDWSDPIRWLDRTDPEVVLVSLGRLGGLSVLGWIGATTFLYALARLWGAGGHSLDWLSIGPFRRAIDAVLAGWLVLGSVSPADALIDSRPEAVPETTVLVDPRYVPTSTGPSSRRGSREERPPEPRRVLVVGGDHLWKLATDELRRRLGREPSPAEIVTYWREVVRTNRENLRSGDPDLIFPGERILLPRDSN